VVEGSAVVVNGGGAAPPPRDRRLLWCPITVAVTDRRRDDVSSEFDLLFPRVNAAEPYQCERRRRTTPQDQSVRLYHAAWRLAGRSDFGDKGWDANRLAQWLYVVGGRP